MKIDAANLQDVMQYTGFDLRTEAENISRDLYQHPQDRPLEDDVQSHPQHYFNVMRMRSIIAFFGRSCGSGVVKEVDDEVFEVLGLALQRRLRDVLDILVRASRHRVDYSRRLFKIKIENDPKKQYWLLERLRTNPPWRAAPAPPVSPNPQQPFEPDQHPLLSQSAKMEAAKKRPPPPPARKDDQTVKAKITNTTAMAAAGMKQRSWMATAPTSSAFADDASAGTSTPDTDEADAAPQPPPPLNLAAAPSSIPLTDADLAAMLRSRTITQADFIAACELDPRLRRSRLHLQLLDLAPLVNN